MLEVLAGLVAGVLIIAGILVMLGPNAKGLVRRIAVLRRRRPSLSAFQPAKPREVVATALNRRRSECSWPRPASATGCARTTMKMSRESFAARQAA